MIRTRAPASKLAGGPSCTSALSVPTNTRLPSGEIASASNPALPRAPRVSRARRLRHEVVRDRQGTRVLAPPAVLLEHRRQSRLDRRAFRAHEKIAVRQDDESLVIGRLAPRPEFERNHACRRHFHRAARALDEEPVDASAPARVRQSEDLRATARRRQRRDPAERQTGDHGVAAERGDAELAVKGQRRHCPRRVRLSNVRWTHAAGEGK